MADRRLVGETHRAVLTLRPGKTIGDEAEHVLVGTVGVQRHSHREVGDRARRERAASLLGATAARDHLVENLWGKTFVSTPTDTHRRDGGPTRAFSNRRGTCPTNYKQSS